MLRAGELIDRKYRLVREIGEGGMAVVWEAIHTTLGSPVAVKLVKTGGRDAERLAARFLVEARAAARVRHRHVVEILDFGRIDGGAPFMVMELLPGLSLEDAIREVDPPTLKDQLRFVAETLSGLAAIHDEGLIHRDLKPANVFVTHDADGEYAKIVDFGLSRTMGEPLPGSAAIAGTPEYMSPEQARGEALDRSTDLYSVGVILYELVTGELPFQDDESLDALLQSVCEGEVLSVRTLPGMPEALADVVETAMHRDRHERFRDARAMRDALVSCTPQLRGMVARQPLGAPAASRSSVALTLEPTLDPIPLRAPSILSTLPPERSDSPVAHPVEEKQTSWRLWGGLLLLAMVGGALYAFVAGGADEVSRVQVSEEPRVAIDLVREPSLEIEADPPPEPPPEPEAESELEPESEPEPEESSEPAVEPRVSRMSSMNATPFAVDEEELARDPGF